LQDVGSCYIHVEGTVHLRALPVDKIQNYPFAVLISSFTLAIKLIWDVHTMEGWVIPAGDSMSSRYLLVPGLE